MIRKLLLAIGLVFFVSVVHAQTSLEGRVTTEGSGEPVLFGTVVLFKNGVQMTGTETDLDGYYSFSNIDPGEYNIEFSYVGYQTKIIEGVVALAGKTTTVNAEIAKGITLKKAQIVAYQVPLVEQDNTTQGDIVTGKEIQNLPIKDVNALAATTAGASSIDNGSISIRGSRTGNTVYIIDGVRVQGRMIPQSEIEQLQVMTGGIPADIGDVTGGVISATTKGPSQKFTGGLELETSEYLDPFGYNLASGNLSGPIFKNKDGQSILGFRVSGQYRYLNDDNPSYVPRYYASEEAVSALEQNPLFSSRGNVYVSAETLRSEENGGQVIEAKSRPNDNLKTIDLTGKLDWKIVDGLDVSISASYYDITNRFTGSRGSASFGLVNYERNPYSYSDGYRANVRIRHKVGERNYERDEDDGAKGQGIIRNVSYTIQGGLEVNNNRVEDVVHEDRFFDYGYIGKFNRDFVPTVGLIEGLIAPPGDTMVEGGQFIARTDTSGVWYRHNGYNERDDSENYFEAGDKNPVLARMQKYRDDIISNGIIGSQVTDVWDFYSNIGMVYDRYSKSNNNLYSGQASLNFDLFPGGSEKGRHNVELGFLYEQRVYRSYVLAPFGLWRTANQLINNEISGIDYESPTSETFTEVVEGQEYEFLIFNPKADAVISDGFSKRFRDANGLPYNEYIVLDEYSPDQLSLEYFSPTELTDVNLMDYSGYDYLGNLVSTQVTFDDFFTGDTKNRKVAAFQPIYYAGYIQDKFSYKDLILRLGVRVDFYDANTKVMKDRYSLYPIVTAAEHYNSHSIPGGKPANIGDDYKVYLSTQDNPNPRGFRNGDTWYDANGNEISGVDLWGTRSVVAAQYEGQKSITDKDFDPSGSFEDYETQINILPRLAFSFPISDEANFFAHYDILTQRPSNGNSYVSPLDYYYYSVPGRTPLANASLKPEKTVDYEVGFQQKLTNASAIKVSAYYKELRDMMQRRTLLYLPGIVSSRELYDNIDFGTVYGFSFTYDLRRTGNLRFKAGYTLQFARGTGSNADSQRGLTTRGNLRNLFFFDYDERHRFTINMDYRYDSGSDYTGPRIGDVKLFENMGLNLQANVVSGRPYTKAQAPTILGQTGISGGINEARLPWVFSLDGRLDRNIQLTSAGEGKRPLFLNIYLRAQNIFNIENIIGLYRYTQSPDDPGYLGFPQGEIYIQDLQTGVRQYTDANLEAFMDAYSWAVKNEGFYTLPRRLYLGVIFQF